MKAGDYYRIYNYKRKHRSLKRKSPFQYLKLYFPDFSDKYPFAFSDSLSRMALDLGKDYGATCLALDKAKDKNATFMPSENRDILQN